MGHIEMGNASVLAGVEKQLTSENIDLIVYSMRVLTTQVENCVQDNKNIARDPDFRKQRLVT
jgi:hypothetical protein